MLGNNLFGIYEKAFSPDLSLEEILMSARSLGFDFVEISIDESDKRLARLDWTVNEREKLKDAIRQSGIAFQSMCLSGHRRFPFGSKDESVRARAYDIMEKAILFAHEFGIRVIQLAGYDVYYEESTPESLERFIEGLMWSCRLAARYQVMLAIEIMDTELISSISRYMEFKSKLPSPWLTVYPDCGNLTAWGNDVDEELELGRYEIVGMHLKDTLAVTENFPGQFKEVRFGEGCVDFTGVFKKLLKMGYSGPYMMEMWYGKGTDQNQEIMRSKGFIEQCFLEASNRE